MDARRYMTLDQWGLWTWGKQLLLSFILDTHKTLQREFYLKARFLSVRFPSLILHKLKKPHFQEKKKMRLPTVTSFHSNHWSRHWKWTRFVPSEDLLSFTFLVKREEHSVFPAAHGHFSLSLKKEKRVTGAIDLRAFNSVIIRQNVCSGGKYIIALVNLLFKQLKHTHKA